MRIDKWYRAGNIAPEPELSRWRLDPEAELRVLGEALRSEDWGPSAWQQLPYPKKGKRLRHFVWPTVRDQVAFTAHMVLLGPLIDSQLESFVFGNRWYRSVIWDRSKSLPRWIPLGYPLLTSHSYLPYARDHGLYRRVASWTVSRMTGALVEENDYGGRVHHPEDYEDNFLPEWTRQEWWAGNLKGKHRAHWAALDIEMAYPSVDLDYLGHCLLQALAADPFEENILRGYPDTVLAALRDEEPRRAIARRLMIALQKVRVRHGDILDASWKPSHIRTRLPSFDEDIGIPTGLAISGVLLNVALAPTDKSIYRYLKTTTGANRGAVLRFADDTYLFSRSLDGLLALMEVVARDTAHPEEASWLPDAPSGGADFESALLRPQSTLGTNLYLNLGKIRPEAVKRLVEEVCLSEGWTRCDDCEALRPPDPRTKTTPVDLWWRSKGKNVDHQMRNELFRASVGPESTGPFVTALVERMSEIGWGGLRERFGEGARERLGRLHELARFDIADEQVRADTRRMFAANRLVAAWLPHEGGKAVAEIRHIRDSLTSVLDRTPWKFALWTAVVRAAARLPYAGAETTEGVKEDDYSGGVWLESQLRRIARPHSPDDDLWWGKRWPEDLQDCHDRGEGWTDLYLSFHRAAFWQGLRTVLAELREHLRRTSSQGAEASRESGPSPDSWCFRAIPDGRHRETLDLLGTTDRWVRVMYGAAAEATDLVARRWELDQFVAAVLSTVPRSRAAVAWLRCQPPGEILRVPAAHPGLGTLTERILRQADRLSVRGGQVAGLSAGALAHLRLAGTDRKTGRVLYRKGVPRIPDWSRDRDRAVKVSQALGCSDAINAAQMGLEVDTPSELIQKIGDEPLRLDAYGAVRRTVLGSESRSSLAVESLYRLLWGKPGYPQELSSWRLCPWDMPAVGLPYQVAARLFLSAPNPTPEWRPVYGPLSWFFHEGGEILAAGRQLQFRSVSEVRPSIASRSTNRDSRLGVGKTQTWDVPPHAAFFLPFLHGPPTGIHSGGYDMYCDVLLLLTALDGSERILDVIKESGTGSLPFEERWIWRSRIHLSNCAWNAIESAIRWSEKPAAAPVDKEGRPLDVKSAVQKSIPSEIATLSSDTFAVERVDLHVDSGTGVEISRAIRTGAWPDQALPDELRIATPLKSNVRVRLGQVVAKVEKPAGNSLRVPAVTRNATMEQVFRAFLAPSYGGGSSPDLVVLPELTIPNEEVRSLRSCVKETGMAALTGLYWRTLAPVYPASGGVRSQSFWIVNEAELAVPVGYHDRGPTSIRWYRVRKPLPSHMEDGRAQALQAEYGGTWKMLPGRRWYRFVHSQWGDFAVAICSDLIDASPWRTLRGEILHLFVVAYNTDVNLYEALTWARAYENYANLVAVNSGNYGGSVAWTPRRRFGRELAQLKGRKMSVLADVSLPVMGLVNAQMSGADDAVCRAQAQWEERKHCGNEFKSPPPGYTRLAISAPTDASRRGIKDRSVGKKDSQG